MQFNLSAESLHKTPIVSLLRLLRTYREYADLVRFRCFLHVRIVLVDLAAHDTEALVGQAAAETVKEWHEVLGLHIGGILASCTAKIRKKVSVTNKSSF